MLVFKLSNQIKWSILFLSIMRDFGVAGAIPTEDTRLKRMNRISIAIRNGKTLEPSLVARIKNDSSSIESIIDTWLESDEFLTTIDYWHRLTFKTETLRTIFRLRNLANPPKYFAYFGRSLGEEPVRLGRYIVSNDLPYTEILTSRHAPQNNFLRYIYAKNNDLKDHPLNPEDDDTWELVEREEPHSGVLTMRSMHLRYPTNDTNRWRSHANQILSQWTCNKLKAVAIPGEKPEGDEAHGTNKLCAGCHIQLDGVANFFQYWDRDGLYNDLYPNVIDGGTLVLPGEEDIKGRGLKDLGKALAKSSTFSRCVPKKIYKFITGEEVPSEYRDEVNGWAKTFVKSNYNIKKLFKDIVVSKAFLLGRRK